MEALPACLATLASVDLRGLRAAERRLAHCERACALLDGERREGAQAVSTIPRMRSRKCVNLVEDEAIGGNDGWRARRPRFCDIGKLGHVRPLRACVTKLRPVVSNQRRPDHAAPMLNITRWP